MLLLSYLFIFVVAKLLVVPCVRIAHYACDIYFLSLFVCIQSLIDPCILFISLQLHRCVFIYLTIS